MKNNKVISFSENGKHEYCATVVRVGEVTPIENSDFLATTIVNGLTIVVRKDEVKEGDICIYCSNESELCEEFCSKNNLYEWHEKEKNANYKEVMEVYGTDPDKAKRMVGFFNKYGRIKMLKLRGVYSMGYLFKPEHLGVLTDISCVNWEDHINEDFDTVGDTLLIKAFVPRIKEYVRKEGKTKRQKMAKRLEKISRLIEGQFAFHYDTKQLAREICRINPDDSVTISVKLHGISFIMANILVREPVPLKYKWLDKLYRIFVPKKFWKFTEHYDDVISSRNLIRNQDFYFDDNDYKPKDDDYIYKHFGDVLKGKIPQDTRIYGEMIGYMPGTAKCMQEGYDYKCREGQAKLMLYRVQQLVDGVWKEFDVLDVLKFQQDLVKKYPELKEHFYEIPIVYHGKMKDLYPDIPVETHWHENVLNAMKLDTKTLGMELNEPLCKNKVFREGVVLRIDGDVITEAFKLKSIKFLYKEGEDMSKGKIDQEMINAEY